MPHNMWAGVMVSVPGPDSTGPTGCGCPLARQGEVAHYRSKCNASSRHPAPNPLSLMAVHMHLQGTRTEGPQKGGRFCKMGPHEVWPNMGHFEKGGEGGSCGLTTFHKYWPWDGTLEVPICPFCGRVERKLWASLPQMRRSFPCTNTFDMFATCLDQLRDGAFQGCVYWTGDIPNQTRRICFESTIPWKPEFGIWNCRTASPGHLHGASGIPVLGRPL